MNKEEDIFKTLLKANDDFRAVYNRCMIALDLILKTESVSISQKNNLLGILSEIDIEINLMQVKLHELKDQNNKYIHRVAKETIRPIILNIVRISDSFTDTVSLIQTN